MLRDDLTRFIQSNLLTEPGATVAPNESLIDRGVLNSIGLMRIMTFLETEAAVRVPDHFVTPTNFATVESIEEMVQELRSAASV